MILLGFKYYRQKKRLQLVQYKLKDVQKQLDISSSPLFENVVNTRPSRPTSARSSNSSHTNPSAPPLNIVESV
ncbi:hypothetical protein MP638_000611 [Amoeboaphelidium occidentale]|nr:hypothetical protein MP638_000611 [Amoeboaphelidium occidentale]